MSKDPQQPEQKVGKKCSIAKALLPPQWMKLTEPAKDIDGIGQTISQGKDFEAELWLSLTLRLWNDCCRFFDNLLPEGFSCRC
jgi:hypothetical protein